MRKTVFLALLIASMVFVSCSGQKEEMNEGPAITGAYVPGQVETAYGYTHGGYVGMAKVMTNDNGDLKVELDETFLPHTLAIVDIESDDWNEDNTVAYTGRRTTYVAKYVSYNGKNYVGGVVGNVLVYAEADEAGMPVGSTDLEKAILRNQASMAAYTALAKAGQFAIHKEFGGEAMPVTKTSYGSVNKKDSPGYWSNGLTWLGNMKAIEDFIAENGVQYNESEMVRAEEADADGLKKWSVADAVTGATNSDFKDYFGLAQHAAGKLKTN